MFLWDMVLVLEQGRLIQTGTHDQLLRLPGPYRETAMLQLMHLGEEDKPAQTAAID